MTYYVEIERLNGRDDYFELASKLHECGIEDAEYDPGPWYSGAPNVVLPHLKFEDENEALVYALKFGGTVKQRIPNKSEI